VIDMVKGNMYICHLGDSRAVVSSGSGLWSSLDHAVPKKMTLETKEGKVSVPIKEGRLAGDLAMRASIGDYSKEMVGYPQVTPDVKTLVLSTVHPTTVILASDGLYERVDQSLLFVNPHRTAKDIIDELGESSFEDNTTIIYACIEPKKPVKAQPKKATKAIEEPNPHRKKKTSVKKKKN